MQISSFREFIVSVPTCGKADTLAKIWGIFQQNEVEQLVVVDERQTPAAIVRLCRLAAAFAVEPSATQAQLSQTCLGAHPTLLEPILCFWQAGDFTDLQSYLTEELHPIAIVNQSGHYVGLLDRLQLLQQMAAFSLKAVPEQPEVAAEPASEHLSTSAFPDPLIDLLERLPLPLMLQTSTGRVITQNLVWRQQVGKIQHPQQIRQAAARILEATLTCETNARPPNPAAVEVRINAPPWIDSPLEESRLQVDDALRTQSPAASEAGACHFGAEPNTCVCVCPMKNGHDRVWRFIKVPMGVSSQAQPLTNWDEILLDEYTMGSPFKLASLKFSPDPNWRSLMQTETLWLVLAQDMTEQQQVAKELAARNADLLQLNRLKDEFLACISHELKTPLTAILGISSLLKDQLIGSLNERQAHYAQLIYRSGRHLVAIVNNILDLTRTETGQLELFLEQVHIASLCQQAYEQAQQQQWVETNTDAATPETEVHFHLEIQPELQNLIADELRLRQMLINLLSNAIKFTEPGGNIGLRVEAWEGWIAFTVWDTGIGIAAEKQHLIFQKFQQLEHPLTRQFRGTGLGLVLTQQLARLHGGDVTFTSTPGQGSEFTLLLPPMPPQASEANFDPTSPVRQLTADHDRNRLVLIVEADVHALADRVEQLSELGYRGVIARSGTEAIEKARRLQPAAILLNPLLPLLSGWDVLTLLKADNSTRNIPIVVVDVRVEREQAYQNGADGFLNLPIEINNLQRCLERLISPMRPELPDASDLTVLHLYEGAPSFTLIAAPQSGASHQCRVLEVDDLEQADLLARVWKPDVILIDQIQSDPYTYIHQLSQATFLANIPIVTLTAELTHAANQIPELSVFPYLAMLASLESGRVAPLDMNELLQVMQLAAGMNWSPQILIMDCAAALAQPEATQIHPPVRALAHYLRTAGFCSTVSQNWGRIQQKLQHQNIDLLLLCVSAIESPAAAAQVVQTLQQLPHPPLVLVWNYQTHSAATTLTEQWGTVATQILPSSLPILELLTQINQTLAEYRRQLAKKQ